MWPFIYFFVLGFILAAVLAFIWALVARKFYNLDKEIDSLERDSWDLEDKIEKIGKSKK